MKNHNSFRLLSAEHSRRPFVRFARHVSSMSGRSSTFVVAFLVVILWAASGPLFGFSNTWQLAINTGTTITTFLMVFLIQNAQNRDSAAAQIKLDELIRVNDKAHTALLDLEELTEEELMAIKDMYEKLASDARKQLRKGKKDTRVREVF